MKKTWNKNGVAGALTIPIAILAVIVIAALAFMAVYPSLSPPAGLYPEGKNPSNAVGGLDITTAVGVPYGGMPTPAAFGFSNADGAHTEYVKDVNNKLFGFSVPRLFDAVQYDNADVTLHLTGPNGYDLSDTQSVKFSTTTSSGVPNTQPISVSFDRFLVFDSGDYHATLTITGILNGNAYSNTISTDMHVNTDEGTVQTY